MYIWYSILLNYYWKENCFRKICTENHIIYSIFKNIHPCFVGPFHHGMARPQVADEGTASDMECSCEYIEYAVAARRRGVVLQLGVWARCKQLFPVKNNMLSNIHRGGSSSEDKKIRR
jgi:hypothetical protein